jgi:hypothetical protein
MTQGRGKTERQLREALSLAGDMMTLDDLVAMAQIGRMQVWGGDEGVIATTIDHWPRGKLLHIYAGAGDLRTLLALEPKIETFARDNGVSAMYAMGRPEWGRVAGHLGWRPFAMTFVKRLDPVN